MKTKNVFNLMNVISWVIFIGYCIKAGAILMVSFISLFGNKQATENLYLGIDLSRLYEFNTSHYVIAVLVLVFITCLKAYIFFMLIRVFKFIDWDKPFNEEVVDMIFKISYVSLTIGVLGIFANSYYTWLRSKVFFSQIDVDTSAYIFMAGVVFIVATLFNRAIEIQQENDLTI